MCLSNYLIHLMYCLQEFQLMQIVAHGFTLSFQNLHTK